MLKPTIYKEPKGVALIIGTWNYAVTLSLSPLCGVIAAGLVHTKYYCLLPAGKSTSQNTDYPIFSLSPLFSFLVFNSWMIQVPCYIEMLRSHLSHWRYTCETYTSIFGSRCICSRARRSRCDYKVVGNAMGTVSSHFQILVFRNSLAL